MPFNFSTLKTWLLCYSQNVSDISYHYSPYLACLFSGCFEDFSLSLILCNSIRMCFEVCVCRCFLSGVYLASWICEWICFIECGTFFIIMSLKYVCLFPLFSTSETVLKVFLDHLLLTHWFWSSVYCFHSSFFLCFPSANTYYYVFTFIDHFFCGA